MVDEIKQLCKERGTTIAAVERICGLGNGTIRKWDTFSPSFARVAKVAEFFGVDPSALYGTEQTKNDPADEGEVDEGLNPDYYNLSPENKAVIDNLIAKLLKSQSDN